MRFLLLALIALSVTSPASAEVDPTECEFSATWGDIGGRQPTVMIVSQNQKQFDDDDSVLVAFFNEDWSISEADQVGRIKVANEEGGWFDNDAIAMKNGFAIWSDFKLIQNVFGGAPSAMFVTRKGKTIDKLRLTGLFSDWIKFTGCRAKKVAVVAEQKRQRNLEREIPKDPFAK